MGLDEHTGAKDKDRVPKPGARRASPLSTSTRVVTASKRSARGRLRPFVAECTGARSSMTLHTTGHRALCVAWHPVDQRTPNLAPCTGRKLYSASHARPFETHVDHTAELAETERTDR